MSTITVARSIRTAGPEAPEGQIEMQEPPVMAEPAPRDFSSMVMMLPVGIGSMAMLLMFSLSANRAGGIMIYAIGGVMAVSLVIMGIVQMGRPAAERKRKMRAERRDYLRYLAQLRKQARTAADEQRSAVEWDNPDPGALWSIAAGPRLWERRASHDDFARVRIGLGAQRAALSLIPPSSKPVEDLEPLSAVSLRRFSETYHIVNGIPVSLGLRSFTSVEFAGDLVPATGLVRALLAQLVTFHAPDEVRLAVLCAPGCLPEWEWVKWLPHNTHPTLTGPAGPVPLVACDHDELMALLGPEVVDRGDHEREATPGTTEPFVVVVAHLAALPDDSRLLGPGLRNVVLLDVTGTLPGGPKVLRLTLHGGQVEFPAGDGTGRAEADQLSTTRSEALARMLAPKRVSGTVELADRPLETDFELTTLLGVRDAYSFDVQSLWRGRNPQRSRMRVPIGVTEGGEVVELDLKESAQGGMGPHGMLIGATGSGKSELLRTLVLGLAATHSSEILNFVLVDFKGGATFLGMEKLPHTSAMITNLADELPLVDRMQDALNGELNRRQELLRSSGQPSLFEYEKARANGEQLVPMPTLFIVVDEFSELLASKPEFMDLFVSIGRLGRSLGVHLLLASQRLDEGRINRVEGHLSYRIALRTFSSMESRSVIGVAKAYELPSEPGNGYLKVDTTTLIRFKGAYVSGPSAPSSAERSHSDVLQQVLRDVVPFRLQPAPVAVPEPVRELVEVTPPDEGERVPTGAPTLAEVFIDRLTGAGPAARQVWLSPLSVAPSLDSLLPSVVPHPELGVIVADPGRRGRLRVPVGIVDRPYEQSRELLTADLSGADGHVAVVGAPQSGKSTLLRTLILALSLTHSPRQAQFYGLDFGGGGIMSVAGLPHVGSVATRMDRDRVVRTIEEVRQVMENRETVFAQRGLESMTAYRALRDSGELADPHGDVFLVVDGWFSLKQDYADLEDRITELAARGLSFGVHVVVSANRWSEIRPRLRDLLGTRFELRLGDSMESEIGSRKAATVPNQPGRGLTGTGGHFLGALPRMDGMSTVDDLAPATKTIAEEVTAFWTGPAAPPVRLLPTVLPAAQLPTVGEGLRICVGQDEQRLAPVWHDFDNTAHLLVFGDSETGKTNLLRLLLAGVVNRYSPDEAKILLGDPQRSLDGAVPEVYRIGYGITADAVRDLAGKASVSLAKRVPGEDISSDRLRSRDWWAGPRLFFVVDDYDLLAPAPGSPGVLEPLIALLAQGIYIGLHVIVARSTSGAMRGVMDPVLRRLWELGTPGAVFSYPKEEGKFLGEAVPRTLPAGRAQLVTRRGAKLIQTGFTGATGGVLAATGWGSGR